VANVKGIKEYIDSVTHRDDTALIYNPVDTALFAPVDDGVLEPFMADRCEIYGDDATVFLFAGRHSVAIDLETFVHALKLLRVKTDKFRAVLIGYGETKEGLQEVVKESDLVQHVKFLPHMPRQELVKYICAADFCFSSTRDEEINEMVVPTKMTEYLSCNKVVVAAHRCPFADEVAELGNAIVSEPGNVQSLAEKLYYCIQHKQALQAHVTSRSYIFDNFSIERFERGFSEFFDSLIAPTEEAGKQHVHSST
jgi:glycosyltransferase involved in cell wall biosynthesis